MSESLQYIYIPSITHTAIYSFSFCSTHYFLPAKKARKGRKEGRKEERKGRKEGRKERKKGIQLSDYCGSLGIDIWEFSGHCSQIMEISCQ